MSFFSSVALAPTWARAGADRVAYETARRSAYRGAAYPADNQAGEDGITRAPSPAAFVQQFSSPASACEEATPTSPAACGEGSSARPLPALPRHDCWVCRWLASPSPRRVW